MTEMTGRRIAVPASRSILNAKRWANRKRAAVRAYNATPVTSSVLPICCALDVPVDRTKIASVPSAASNDTRRSARGASTSPPPASQTVVRACASGSQGCDSLSGA